MPSDTDDSTLAAAVNAARHRPEVHAAVHSLYDRLQSQIDVRKPRCAASGECCRFDSYGHRLYVTTIEVATFLADHSSHRTVLIQHSNRSLPILTDIANACRFQIAGLCSVHSIRPFGCRIFFCDPTASAWQQERYELFHQELKQLHEKFHVQYSYVEWRGALATCNDAK